MGAVDNGVVVAVDELLVTTGDVVVAVVGMVGGDGADVRRMATGKAVGFG